MWQVYSEKRGKVVYAANGIRSWRNHKFEFVDLCHASFIGMDLRGCVFECCRLMGANFAGAQLQGARFLDCSAFRTNFLGADMTNCYIDNTHLTGDRDELGESVFSYCYFTTAVLRGAYLAAAMTSHCNFERSRLTDAVIGDDVLRRFDCARLTGAVGIPKAIRAAVPKIPKGRMTGWKRCTGNRIVELMIPEDAERSAGLSRKCRASHAHTVEILSTKNRQCTTARSFQDTGGQDCAYRVGYMTVADKWDTDRWRVCTNGIHFFLTREEAVAYHRRG